MSAPAFVCGDCGATATGHGDLLPPRWEWYNGRPGSDRVICPVCVGRILDAVLAAMRAHGRQWLCSESGVASDLSPDHRTDR